MLTEEWGECLSREELVYVGRRDVKYFFNFVESMIRIGVGGWGGNSSVEKVVSLNYSGRLLLKDVFFFLNIVGKKDKLSCKIISLI